jgi:hypothetical protein
MDGAKVRRRFGRTLIMLLLSVLLWIVMIQAWLSALNRPAARAWLAQALARKLTAALAEPVRVTDVSFTAFPPHVVVTGVEVGGVGATLARLDRGEALLSQIRIRERELVLSQVRLKGLRVNLDVPKRSGAGGSSWLHVVVRQLELVDVTLERVRLPSGVEFQARDFEARWTGSPSWPASAAVIHLGSFAVRVPGMQTIEGSLAAWGRQTPDGWEVRRMRGRGRGWNLDAHASHTRQDGITRASGHVDVDLAELQRVLAFDVGFSGVASASPEVEVNPTGFRINTSVRCPRLTVVGFEVAQVEGDAQLTGDGLETSLQRAVFAGGEVEGSYRLSPLGAPWRHRVALRGDGVDIAAFLRQIGVNDAGLSGRALVSAELAWSGEHIKGGDGTAVVDVREQPGEVPVSGRLVLGLAHDGALRFFGKNLSLAGASVRWEGPLTLGSWIPSWTVRAENARIATVARLLRGWVGSDVLPAGLNGQAVTALRLSGPFADLTVTGEVAAAPVNFGPITADGAEAAFQVARGKLVVESGAITVGSGRVLIQGELAYGHGMEMRFDLLGKGLPLARVLAWGGIQGPFSGRVDLDGSVGGTFAAPSAHALLKLANVAVAGVPFGDGNAHVSVAEGVAQLNDLRVGPLSATLSVHLERREAVVNAELRGFGLAGISKPLAGLLGGALDCSLQGAFPFDEPAGTLAISSASGFSGQIALDRDGLRVALERPQAWRLAGSMQRRGRAFGGGFTYGIASLHRLGQQLANEDWPFDGTLEGHATLTIGPEGPPRIDGAVDALALTVEGERAELQEPARFSVEGGAIRLVGARLTGPRSSLFVRGSRSPDGALSGNISGELHAAPLGLIWKGSHPSGRVEILGEILGTDTAPRFEGVARMKDGALQVPGLQGPVTGIAGTVELVEDAIKITGAKGEWGGGELTCTGLVRLSPSLALDLVVDAVHTVWPLIAGVRPVLSGVVRVGGPLDSLAVTGELSLDRTDLAPNLSLEKVVLSQLTAPQRVGAQEGNPVRFNILVTVPGTLELNLPSARLSGRGELRVVGTSDHPGVIGRVETQPGGEVDLAGVRYSLDHGTVAFSRPDRIEPFVDVLARANVQNFEITVGLVGTLDKLTPTFISNPPLPEMDIISLLSTGQKADQATQWQSGNVASSFLTNQLTGAVTNRARTLLNVDQLRVDPFYVTSANEPAARLTVVKQLSHSWTVAVSTNLTSNREEVVDSRWRLATGLYLEAKRDEKGAYSVEVQWQRRY